MPSFCEIVHAHVIQINPEVNIAQIKDRINVTDPNYSKVLALDNVIEKHPQKTQQI